MPFEPELVMLVAEELAAQRALLFRESAFETAERVALGLAWALKPERAVSLPPYLRRWIGNLFTADDALPAADAPADPDGTVGIVNDLSVPTLLEAYKRGLYTAGHFGSLAWTAPAERCVLFFDEIHIAKRLRRLMRQGRYTVTFDRAFERVIKACAGRREGRWHVTWITPRIMRAYAALYDAGHVHSFEVWNADRELVGGGYGVAIGRVFFTESQFSLEANTSKLGFTVLNWHLNSWGYRLNDGKKPTPTILDMGFRNIPRREFVRRLTDGTAHGGKSGRWQIDADAATVAAWEPAARRA